MTDHRDQLASELADDGLRWELDRRFRTTTTEIPLGDRPVVLLHPASYDDLISEEEFVRDERLPYWADIWPASTVLAARIAAMAGAGQRFLELGCGAGLVTVAAARAGFDVTATDYYDDALLFARENAWRDAGVVVAARHVDWRKLPRDLGTFDLVVASDVLYEREYGELVAKVFARTLAAGALGIVADPGRIAAADFVEASRELGLAPDVREIVELPISETIRQTITLYELRGPRRG